MLSLQHTVAHCNALQHTATHCNTLQHILRMQSSELKTQILTATHRTTPQHTATHRNTPQHTATHRNTPQCTATQHCNTTLQHTEDAEGTTKARTKIFFGKKILQSQLASQTIHHDCKADLFLPGFFFFVCGQSIQWQQCFLFHTCPVKSACFSDYGVATCSRLLKMIGLFCKRALWKRRYSAKETCNFKEPTNRSPPLCIMTVELTLFLTVFFFFRGQSIQLQQCFLFHTCWWPQVKYFS